MSERLPWRHDFPRPRWVGDGTSTLTLFVVLLMCIPAQFVVGPLGAAGTPAQILAMLLSLWWLGRKLARPFSAVPDRQPVRIAMLIFVACAMISYVFANLRPIIGIESRAADRGLLILVAWLGLVLVAGDHIISRARLDTLIRRLVLAGAGVAALGIVQFQTGMAFVDMVRVPGLKVNSALTGVVSRDGFYRPAGTALHPIEFGVAMTMLLPLALHLALNDTRSGPWRRWLPVVLLASSIPISVSRSAVVCASVGILLMLPVMSARTRVFTGIATVGGLCATFVLVPGMLGTLLGLFTGIGADDSAASRTSSYTLAGEFIGRAPLFGRGFATFLPAYRILDNQFLGTTIELGLVGVTALIVLFLTGILTAAAVRRRSEDPSTKLLAQALMACLAAGASSYAFFDAFSFPMVACLTFLTLGMIGGLRRLSMMSQPVVRTPG